MREENKLNTRRKTRMYLFVFLLGVSLLTSCKEASKEKGIETIKEIEEMEAGAEEKIEEKKDEKVLMTIGKEAVSLEEANTYIFFLKKQYENRIGSVIWAYELEGKTMEEYAKDQIKSLLTQVKITKQVAEKEGIILSEDEIDEAKNYSKEYWMGVTEEEKKKYNIEEEYITQIFQENILANKVFEITTNDVDTNIPEEEARQVTIQYLMVMTKGTDRNGIIVNMNDEEKAEARNKGKKLLNEAKDTDNFLSFAERNTDDTQVSLTFSKLDAPEELKKISFELDSGQLSTLIVGENGYYIVYCVNNNDEDATAAKKEELILERQRASFEKKFTRWSADYEIVISAPLWDKITF